MSKYTTNSPKHCAEKKFISLPHLKILNKKLIFSLSSLILSLLLLFILFFLILHPSKPQFHLRDMSVDKLNLSSPPLPRLLNSTIQVTIESTNPNTHVGVYYDRLSAYASYKGQRVTADAELPPFYQGSGDSDLLTASLTGIGIPMSAALGYEVARDKVNGRVVVSVRLDGEMRWKVGNWVSWRHRFDVDCVATIRYDGGGGSGVLAGEVGSVEGAACTNNV